MDSRDRLVEAAKTLLWERGIAATSPHALLAAARVGQGSLYHHFRDKNDWAAAAIDALARDLDTETAQLLDDPQVPGRQRIYAYLDKPRGARAGCRLGRLAFDPYLLHAPQLAAPIAAFFQRVRDRLIAAARAAQAEGDVPTELDPADLAAAVISVVQGGYVLARGIDDDTAMNAATRALRTLLDLTVHNGGSRR